MSRSEGAALAGVLLAYLSLTVWFSAVTPIFEGYDEPSHLQYIHYVYRLHRLPPIPAPETAESFQPPLYYVAGAALMAGFRMPEPPFSVFRPAGSRGLAKFEHPPGQDTHVVLVTRLLSTLFGLLTVAATYLLSLVALPGRRDVALAAAAFVGFLPQFDFINSLITNDSLATTLATFVLLGSAGIAAGRGRAYALLAGIALGALFLTKEYAFAFLAVPLAAVAIAQVDWRTRAFRLGEVTVPALLIAGPWFLRNFRKYGQPWPWTLEHQAQRDYLAGGQWYPRSISQLLFESPFLHRLYDSFWYLGGWGQLRPPTWFYVATGVVLLAALAGLVVARREVARNRVLWLFGFAFGIELAATTYANLTLTQPAGRYLFPAIGGVAALLALGMGALFGERLKVVGRLALPAGMAILCLYILLLVAGPAYS